MKTFFTKYLPVEGEIKMRDWYFNNKGELCLYQASLPKYEYRDAKKAQLFLCSRDIQVGDIVYPLFTPQTISSAGTTPCIIGDIPDKRDIHIYREKMFFKAIGKISSDATWVGNGDEFDEDEVKLIHYTMILPIKIG